MDLTTFINEETGKLVNSSKGIEGQCVSVPALWQEKNNQIAIFGATALAIWQYNRGDWDVIPNTPDGVPSPGDIFFFGASYGGGAGHTGIVVNANTSSVTLFEQNDPDGSTAHEKTYNYNDAQGWFHPHFLNQTNQGAPVMNAQEEQDHYVNFLGRESDVTLPTGRTDPEWMQDAKPEIMNNVTELKGLRTQVSDLQHQVAVLQAEVAAEPTTPPVNSDGSVPVPVTVNPAPAAPIGFFATAHGQELLRLVSTVLGIAGTAVASIFTGHSAAVVSVAGTGGALYNAINYIKDLLDPTVPS